jgi:hypothetical protein
MTGEQPAPDEQADHTGPAGHVDREDHGDHDGPIDVSGALGEAGHETADLHAEDVGDTAPVLHDAAEGDPEDPEDEILRHVASRGVDGVT